MIKEEEVDDGLGVVWRLADLTAEEWGSLHTKLAIAQTCTIT